MGAKIGQPIANLAELLDAVAKNESMRMSPASNDPTTAGTFHIELSGLRKKVKELTESGAQGVLLDPDEIHLSRYANRHELAFLSQDFKELCAQIEVTGGNVQPVGVVRGEGGRLRLVFGHRRHRACKQLGLKVRAIEIPGPIPEAVLLKYMQAENAARKDLTVYEPAL